MAWNRQEIAQRAARELRDGDVVNLGIGLPTEVANFLPDGVSVVLHTENGLLGMGPYPLEDEIDPQIINAGKELVTLVSGASSFDSSMSFAMIRGGHVDVAILGGLEVACNGDLANWTVPGKMITGMGGAMDLARGAKRVLVLLTHTSKDGTPKLLLRCTLPLTALACTNLVVTELGVFDCKGERFVCVDQAPGVSREEIRAKTGAPVEWSKAS